MEDQIRESNDELTESSSDELKDLQKEYELKLQKILEKKKSKQKLQKKEIEPLPKVEAEIPKTIPQIPLSPEKKEVRVAKKENTEAVKIQASNQSSNQFQGKKPPAASSFVKKLYEAGSSKSNIDYDNRIYEFENIPKPQNIDLNERDQYSGEVLRKKYITEDDLKRLLENIKVLKVEKALAKIAPPDYAEPPYENWCLIGFVVGKSEPKTSKDKKKYIKISVGNYNHSIDIMLFAEAFKKYWKLQLGELIVVLNPQLNVFKPPFKGFNLKLDGAYNSILEIGSVASFGYCSAMKKDNQRCTNVVNTKQNSLCAYHLDAHFKQSQNKRMELSGSVHLKSPTRNGKKQSMYLNKDGKNGYLDFNTINEKTTVYGINGGGLDSSHYHRPEILDSVTQKRRKLKDERNNKLLEEKLSSLSNNSTAKKLGLIKKQPEVKSKKIFTSETLAKIGFNPIVTNSTYDSPSKKRSKLNDDIKELYTLSQSTVKSLDSSIAEQHSKKRKWKKNLNELKQYLEKYVGQLFPVKEKNSTNTAYYLSDSCSDLEIAFDDHRDEKKYNGILERM